MAKLFTDFQQEVDARLQDDAAKLVAEEKDRFIKQAILSRYSQDRPIESVDDEAGNGTADLTPPNGFEDGFSIVRSVEYPTDNVPASVLEQDQWEMYRSPTGLKVRLLSAKPPASENIRVTWTKRHTDTGATVPEPDFEAVVDFAASLCFDALAAVHVQTGDATLLADSVNYRTKSQEYLGLSKRLRTRYFNHIGISEGDAGEAAAPAAMSIGDMDNTLATGHDRLTHRSGDR